MLFKEITQSFNKNLYFEKKIILDVCFCKYYIKKVIKSYTGLYIKLDNHLLSVKHIDKLSNIPVVHKHQLIATSVNLKNFIFKSSFELNKTFELPYFPLNKLSRNVILQNVKKKYLQLLNTSNLQNCYNFAKLIKPNKSGFNVKTFSGLRGFIPKSEFIIFTKFFFFTNI